MQYRVRSSGGELMLGSQKELFQLLRRGVLADDDEILRGDRWVRVADLPWIRGTRHQEHRDGRKLLWITLAMMLLGLGGVLWIQSHAGTAVRRAGVLPPGAVHAVPR